MLLGHGKVAAIFPKQLTDSLAPNQNISGDHKNIVACPDFETPANAILSVGAGPGVCPFLDPGSVSIGYGISFRLRVVKHWYVECYYDYFKTNILNLGYRHDMCAGCSVLYTWVENPYKKHSFTPYVFAGLGFDNNKVYSYEVYNYQNQYDGNSPWFNLGYQEEYNITTRFAIALEGFYGVPLSTHPVSDIIRTGNPEYMIVKTKPGFNAGGAFIIFSLNYKLL
jgi:hypothetical protein